MEVYHTAGPAAKTHVIKKGETLTTIVKNGYTLSGAALKNTVSDVADINGIPNPDDIAAGVEILLP